MSEDTDQYKKGAKAKKGKSPTPLTVLGSPVAPGKDGQLSGGVSPNQMLQQWNQWRDYYNPLRRLTMSLAVSWLEAGQRGEFADLQWLYFFCEQSDADLMALIERRASALLQREWTVKISAKMAKKKGFDQALAEEQQDALNEQYEGIDNVYEAVEHLGLSSFRGYSHVEKYRNADGDVYHLEPVEQWNMIRWLRAGPWKYNPSALSTTFVGLPEDMLIDPANFLIRETSRPINRLALIKKVRENLCEKDWDAFVEIYGIPRWIVVGPPNVPPEKEKAYQSAAHRIAEGSGGYLPNGSDAKAASGERGVNPFKERMEHLSQKLVLAGTGGLLTMLTAPGSGTLAGSAHTEAFEMIARRESRQISEIFQQKIDAEFLDAHFPGQPHLVYFDLGLNDEADVGEVVKHALTLRQAGYKMDMPQLSEKTGYTLTEGPIETVTVRDNEAADSPADADKGAISADSKAQKKLAPGIRNREGTASSGAMEDHPAIGAFLARARDEYASAAKSDLRPLATAILKVLGNDDSKLADGLQTLRKELPDIAAEVFSGKKGPAELEKILSAALFTGLTAEANGVGAGGGKERAEKDPAK
jgi:phage gp29-like protein